MLRARETDMEAFMHPHMEAFVDLKLRQEKFSLDIKKKNSSQQEKPIPMTEHWNALPREMVQSLSLAVFKKRLDVALSAML